MLRRTHLVLLLPLLACAGEAAPPEVAGSSTHAAFVSPYPGWSVASGQASASLGMALDGGGDINGDGFEDVLVGLPGYDDGQASEGAVFMYLGDGTSFEAEPAWIEVSNEPYAFLGGAVSIVGDVNDDGFDDVAIGGWQQDVTFPNEGRTQLFCGSETGLSDIACHQVFGQQDDAHFGFSLDGGDINGDGFADLIVGAPGFDGEAGEDEGAVFYYLGSETGLPALGFSGRILGGLEGAGFGYAVSVGGDVNDDGFDDLLVGSPTFAQVGLDEGLASLYLGSEDGLLDVPDWTTTGGLPSIRLGHSVDIAGDLNGDGVADMLIGVPWFDDLAAEQGQAQVYFGSDSGFASTPDWTFLGIESGGLFGVEVAGVGDLDGNLVDDIMVGASHSEIELPYEGQLFTFPSLAGTGPALLPGKIIEGGQMFAFFGTAIAAAGDVNDDGYDDALIGAWDNTVDAAGEGTTVLLYGVPATVDVDDDGFCAEPDGCTGLVPGGDCNDLDPGIYPGAEEICDGIDQDCDGTLPADEQDTDADGWMPCEGDCDNGDATINPAALEQCDELDHDCDGLIDNGVVPPRYWTDGDGDGHGNPLGTVLQSCSDPGSGWSPTSDDCDDADSSISPSATEETCTGIDEDCSFLTPDVPDRDGDAFTPCEDCQLLGTTLQCGDCDDTNQEINPYMGETCEDGIDQNCDGEDPDCAIPPECNQPDNICEDIGCSCSSGDGPPPAFLLLLLPLAAIRRVVR